MFTKNVGLMLMLLTWCIHTITSNTQKSDLMDRFVCKMDDAVSFVELLHCQTLNVRPEVNTLSVLGVTLLHTSSQLC